MSKIHLKSIIAGFVFSCLVSAMIFLPQVSNSQTAQAQTHVPSWIKKAADMWTDGQISDEDFAKSMQYLIEKGVLHTPTSSGEPTVDNQNTQSMQNSIRSWAAGHGSSDDFVNGITYLIQKDAASIQSHGTGQVANGITTSQATLSDSDLLSVAGNKYADGNIPLGDSKYVTAGPKKGFIYLCHIPPQGHGASGTGPWIHGSTWNFLSKMSVKGSVLWDKASFSNTVIGNMRTLSGNDLPIGNVTGTFPISNSDPISQYDQNPNSISAQSFSSKLPTHPAYSETPYCMGGEVGIMLTGVPLFNGFDAELRDAPAHEAQDSCNGHPQNSGEYHYHNLSACIKDASEKTVLGYALDGFPITGPKVADGKYLTTDDLDECHGITSQINENGMPVTTYHYVMTYDFPYSASCFRGKPVEYTVISSQGHNGPTQNMPSQNMPGQIRAPPQEAINACASKPSGEYCSFVSPRGDTITGTCQMPHAGPLACVPG